MDLTHLPDEAAAVLRFWFEECQPAQWWKVDAGFDAEIARRFGALHERASAGERWTWRATPAGRLAEILVLDQFSRNLYRGQARAFAQDAMALVLAQEAVAAGVAEALAPEPRRFLLMPYMHSESVAIHAEAEALFARHGPPDALDFERRHAEIVRRFGRYPHRNEVLGRPSTPEELAFLQQPGSRF
ncbi:DUF924 family protein [Inhella sp.]|uniref:DUF924 family protein n=1 Tax=Inhella sp. TaxID=1921806 RepID=UPI0035B25F24